MSAALLLLSIGAAGLLMAVAAWAGLKRAGARPEIARRLAGPAELAVGDLFDVAQLPSRPVRITGRIRCADPLRTVSGDRLVAFHRDVEVLAGGSWRSVERVRESRSFELWDHGGSLSVDLALASEPLITIPRVWRGDAAELTGALAASTEQITQRSGPIEEARSTTRTISVADRVAVVGLPSRDASGRLSLEAPPGGYIATNLALPDAMRLLGGGNRRLMRVSIAAFVLGALLTVVGIGGAIGLTLLSREPSGGVADGATPGPPSTGPTRSPRPTPRLTLPPTPSAEPTPRFTNAPDPQLAALIPQVVAGIALQVPPVDEFALTPGDVGSAYGELGTRFESLAVGFVVSPRTTLYAVRVDGAPVATAELEEHLATAGRYVGIAGLDRAAWQQTTVDGAHQVWMRPEDNATAAGTTIYTWAAREFVFLLIGVNDSLNREIVAALPGEPPPSPPPAPSLAAPPSDAPSPSPDS